MIIRDVEIAEIGFDVAKVDGDRIGQVYGFLDKVPTAS